MKLRGRHQADDFRAEVALSKLHNMASRSEKFARKPSESKAKDEVPKESEEVIKFSPEEEAVRPFPCLPL